MFGVSEDPGLDAAVESVKREHHPISNLQRCEHRNHPQTKGPTPPKHNRDPEKQGQRHAPSSDQGEADAVGGVEERGAETLPP